MEPADVLDVAAEDGRLHVSRADHVVRHEQELLALDPAVLDADRRQPSVRAGPGVVLQEQVQHGHEVALARAEAAVQVGGLAVAPSTAARMNPSASSKASASWSVTT